MCLSHWAFHSRYQACCQWERASNVRDSSQPQAGSMTSSVLQCTLRRLRASRTAHPVAPERQPAGGFTRRLSDKVAASSSWESVGTVAQSIGSTSLTSFSCLTMNLHPIHIRGLTILWTKESITAFVPSPLHPSQACIIYTHARVQSTSFSVH